MAFRESVLVAKVNKFYFFMAKEVQVSDYKISCAKKKTTTLFSLTELTLIRTIVMEKETRLKVNSLSLFHFGPVEQIYAQIWTMSIPLLLMNDYNTIAIYKYRLGIEYIYYVIYQLAGVFLLSKFLIWLVILLTIW